MNTVIRKRTYEWANPLDIAEMSKALPGMELLIGIMDGSIPTPPICRDL